MVPAESPIIPANASADVVDRVAASNREGKISNREDKIGRSSLRRSRILHP